MPRVCFRAIALFSPLLFAAYLAGQGETKAQFFSQPEVKPAGKVTASQPRKKAAKKDSRKDSKKGKAGKKKEAAKDLRVWTFSRPAGGPLLEFGTPGRSEPAVSFSCQIDAGLVRVISHIGSKGVQPGDGARIRLSNGSAKVEIAGTAYAAETKEAVDVAGVTKMDSKLFALFRGGDTMLLEVPGRKNGLPLKSLGTKAEAFEKSCAPRR